MSDFLDQIAARKAAEVARKRLEQSQTVIEQEALAASPPRGFRAALVRDFEPGRLALIAEIKRASPSRGIIRARFDPPTHARAYEKGGATCLSVLTETPSFGAREGDLTAARAAVRLPVLRKDFLVHPWQVAESRALGADAILVILNLVDDGLATELILEATRFGMDSIVEVHDEAEMTRAVRLGALLIGVNNRDLRTFETNLATTGRLAAMVPPETLLVSESGISDRNDLQALAALGAHAALVGESLMRQADLLSATRRLLRTDAAKPRPA